MRACACFLVCMCMHSKRHAHRLASWFFWRVYMVLKRLRASRGRFSFLRSMLSARSYLLPPGWKPTCVAPHTNTTSAQRILPDDDEKKRKEARAKCFQKTTRTDIKAIINRLVSSHSPFATRARARRGPSSS